MLRILVLGLLLSAPMCGAQTLPNPITDTVSDFADLLSDAQEADLTAQMQEARATTGVQVVLATMDRIETYGAAGQSIESYAKKLFNAWGIGHKTRNDGVLILIAKEDREMRIALGAGFSPVYDGLAQRVMDRDVLPLFREDNYSAGIQAAVTGTIDRIAVPFAEHTPPENLVPSKSWTDFIAIALFGLAVGAIVVFSGRRQIGDFMTQFRPCPSCGARTQTRNRMVEVAATADQAGQGIQVVNCDSCRHVTRTVYPIAPLGNKSQSISGGFGGGGSSGGGATGRW